MPTATPKAPTLSELAERLDGVLDAYLVRYDQLAKQVAAQREALRKADGVGVDAATNSQRVILEAIAMLESRRGSLINDAAACLPSLAAQRTGPITLRDLAKALPNKNAPELLQKAELLRARVLSTQEATRVVGSATRSLLGHIEGLMRTVAQHASHAGTYSHKGVVEAGGAVVSSLDLRS
ncbi:MAG: flagellar export chaperone FlgN [Phycisphaerales bacterium]|jgi:hypothetical protein